MLDPEANPDQTVYVVDDDPHLGESIVALLESVQIKAIAMQSAQEFLDQYCSDEIACLLCDLCMPRTSGLDLQAEILRRGWQIPILFLSAYGDVQTAVQAMQSGAVDFIEKPYRAQDLLDRIQLALTKAQELRAAQQQRRELIEDWQQLSPRELEAAELLVKGLSSKEIARQMGISVRTAELHRRHVLEKMHCKTALQLVSKLSSSHSPIHQNQ